MEDENSIEYELERYKSITDEVTRLKTEIELLINEYQESLNWYFNAHKLTLSKNNDWKTTRLKKLQKVNEKFKNKWANLSQVKLETPELSKNEDLYIALLQMTYKRPTTLKKFLTEREKRIQNVIKEAVTTT